VAYTRRPRAIAPMLSRVKPVNARPEIRKISPVSRNYGLIISE